MPLTDTAIRNSKPAERPYKVSDGGGLHLVVNPNGSRLWRFKYRMAGREKLLFGRTLSGGWLEGSPRGAGPGEGALGGRHRSGGRQASSPPTGRGRRR